MTNRSIAFFDAQFCIQTQQQSYALNPFEKMVLSHLSGKVLDPGSGFGNLSVEAARGRCTVHALDAAPAEVEDLGHRAQALDLRIVVELADLARYRIKESCDCVVAIGLSQMKAVFQLIQPANVSNLRSTSHSTEQTLPAKAEEQVEIIRQVSEWSSRLTLGALG